MALIAVDKNYSQSYETELKCNVKSLYNITTDLQVDKLTVLNLSGLGLTEIDENIPEITHLYEINLSNNKLEELPTNLTKAKRLRILNLSRNHFSAVPECLLIGLRTLKHINLSENHLKSFDKAPASLPLLRELLLACNDIHKFPQWLLYDHVYMLDVINLSLNPCFSVQRHFNIPAKNRLLGSLKNLILRNTNFTIVSLGLLSHFPTLLSLDLCNSTTCDYKKLLNFVTEIKIGYLPVTLVELRLRDIGLSCLPDLSELKQLRYIDVSANLLHWLPSDSAFMSNLCQIDLSNTKLIMLQDYIGSVTSLTHLLLSGNDLSSLPSSIKQLKNLEVLDLYNNSLDTIPDLTCLKHLQALDLWMNYFEPPQNPLGKEGPLHEDLKKKLRHSYSFENRHDMAKVEEVIYTDESGSLSSFYSTSPENGFVIPETVKSSGKFEEEKWECFSDDDLFDPTEENTYSKDIYKYIEGRHFGKNCVQYCSQDIQNSPHLFQPYLERSITECWEQKRIILPCHYEEGQFDDAP